MPGRTRKRPARSDSGHVLFVLKIVFYALFSVTLVKSGCMLHAMASLTKTWSMYLGIYHICVTSALLMLTVVSTATTAQCSD